MGLSLRERPITTLGVISGAAFAAGAICMLRYSRQQSQFNELLAQLPDPSIAPMVVKFST